MLERSCEKVVLIFLSVFRIARTKFMRLPMIGILFLFPAQVLAGTGDGILPMKERAETIDRLLKDRLEHLPQKLMRREAIDMWILIAREYNEDPIVKTMLPGTAHAARRRTILVFVDEGEAGVLGYAVSRYGVGDFFKPVWDPEKEPDQWQALSDLITAKKPERIGINVSKDFALSSYFTAMHKPVHSAVIALSRSLVLPGLLLLVLPGLMGSDGIYISIPIAEAITFILATILYWRNQPVFE